MKLSMIEKLTVSRLWQSNDMSVNRDPAEHITGMSREAFCDRFNQGSALCRLLLLVYV